MRVLLSLAAALLAAPSDAVSAVFTSEKGGLFLNGEGPLSLKGLNFYGFQTPTGVFHGLWAQPPSYFLDEVLVKEGVNAVRVPLDLDLMLNDRVHQYITPEADEGYPSPLMANSSLEVRGAQRTHVSGSRQSEPRCDEEGHASGGRGAAARCARAWIVDREVLDWFIDEFAARGIVVLLDLHCLDTGGTNASPVFFNDDFSLDDTLAGWSAMAQRFATKWNVLGADVFNEPFGATWAEGADTDMDAFAVRAAAAIHEYAPEVRATGAAERQTRDIYSLLPMMMLRSMSPPRPRVAQWLIFVEGASASPNCTAMIDGDLVVCGCAPARRTCSASRTLLAVAL